MASIINWQAAMAEFLSMAFFVYVGTGAAVANTAPSSGPEDSAWVTIVALQFGLAIVTLAYASRGGQINCAVTFGLVLSGALSVTQGLVNFVVQVLGSIAGASLLFLTTSVGDSDGDTVFDRDFTGGLGSNTINGRYNVWNALVGEIILTGLLVFVVFETAVSKKSIAGSNAPMAIGFAVFLAHTILIPIDGCSINPTRSLGPAIVATLAGVDNLWDDHWVFWLGPLLGAAIVGLTKGKMIMNENAAMEELTEKSTHQTTQEMEMRTSGGIDEDPEVDEEQGEKILRVENLRVDMTGQLVN
jgi:aquaporin PIP